MADDNGGNVGDVAADKDVSGPTVKKKESGKGKKKGNEGKKGNMGKKGGGKGKKRAVFVEESSEEKIVMEGVGHRSSYQNEQEEERNADSWRNEELKTPGQSDDGTRDEVHCLPTKVSVNLGTQICTCRPEDYYHGWLTMASYRATYEHHIQPLQGEEFWSPTDQLPPIPLTIKKKTVCGGKKHNKQTCPVAKKQRHEEYMAQQKDVANSKVGPSNTTVLPQTEPTTSAIGPTPTVGGSVVQGPKLNIRGKKGATAQKGSPRKRPPPSSPKLNAEDSNKARQFVPTHGFMPQGP
ncbi:hypothetical protein SESBI_09617 [Sesbania bispinosa]|nr:hypothetical protein SESBI_09617 [Sesbania bispinosa]